MIETDNSTKDGGNVMTANGPCNGDWAQTGGVTPERRETEGRRKRREEETEESEHLRYIYMSLRE
jgi:hypothetical protein